MKGDSWLDAAALGGVNRELGVGGPRGLTQAYTGGGSVFCLLFLLCRPPSRAEHKAPPDWLVIFFVLFVFPVVFCTFFHCWVVL